MRKISTQVFNQFARVAEEKGWISSVNDVVEKYAAEKEIYASTGNLFLDLVKLGGMMKKAGMYEEAEKLAAKVEFLKAAEVHLYRVHDEDGSDLIEFAHPDGDVWVADAQGGLGDSHTSLSQSEMVLEVLNKKPTGKQAKVNEILVKASELISSRLEKLAQDGESQLGGTVEESATPEKGANATQMEDEAKLLRKAVATQLGDVSDLSEPIDEWLGKVNFTVESLKDDAIRDLFVTETKANPINLDKLVAFIKAYNLTTVNVETVGNVVGRIVDAEAEEQQSAFNGNPQYRFNMAKTAKLLKEYAAGAMVSSTWGVSFKGRVTPEMIQKPAAERSDFENQIVASSKVNSNPDSVISIPLAEEGLTGTLSQDKLEVIKTTLAHTIVQSYQDQMAPEKLQAASEAYRKKAGLDSLKTPILTAQNLVNLDVGSPEDYVTSMVESTKKLFRDTNAKSPTLSNASKVAKSFNLDLAPITSSLGKLHSTMSDLYGKSSTSYAKLAQLNPKLSPILTKESADDSLDALSSSVEIWRNISETLSGYPEDSETAKELKPIVAENLAKAEGFYKALLSSIGSPMKTVAPALKNYGAFKDPAAINEAAKNIFNETNQISIYINGHLPKKANHEDELKKLAQMKFPPGMQGGAKPAAPSSPPAAKSESGGSTYQQKPGGQGGGVSHGGSEAVKAMQSELHRLGQLVRDIGKLPSGESIAPLADRISHVGANLQSEVDGIWGKNTAAALKSAMEAGSVLAIESLKGLIPGPGSDADAQKNTSALKSAIPAKGGADDRKSKRSKLLAADSIDSLPPAGTGPEALKPTASGLPTGTATLYKQDVSSLANLFHFFTDLGYLVRHKYKTAGGEYGFGYYKNELLQYLAVLGQRMEALGNSKGDEKYFDLFNQIHQYFSQVKRLQDSEGVVTEEMILHPESHAGGKGGPSRNSSNSEQSGGSTYSNKGESEMDKDGLPLESVKDEDGQVRKVPKMPYDTRIDFTSPWFKSTQVLEDFNKKSITQEMFRGIPATELANTIFPAKYLHGVEAYQQFFQEHRNFTPAPGDLSKYLDARQVPQNLTGLPAFQQWYAESQVILPIKTLGNFCKKVMLALKEVTADYESKNPPQSRMETLNRHHRDWIQILTTYARSSGF